MQNHDNTFPTYLTQVPVTDLRRGHGLGHHAFGAPRNSFLWRLVINLTFVKLRSGITSQFTLKRAKMQTSRHLSVSDNTIILFTMTRQLSIGVLQCLAVLCCFELFVRLNIK